MKRVYRTGGYAESIEDRRLCREYGGQEGYAESIEDRRLCSEDRRQGFM